MTVRSLSFSLVLTASTLGSADCGYAGIVAPPTPEKPTVEAGAAVDAGVEGDANGNVYGPAAIAFDAVAPPGAGSPLCNASLAMGCYPDAPTPAVACPVDSGAVVSPVENPDASFACRVTADSDGYHPYPQCQVPGPLTAGQPCATSSQCAAQLDCVTVGGTSLCEPYCCMGTCSNTNDFCDIAALATQSLAKVPVCVPLVHCELLANGAPGGDCPAKKTCSVVRADGQTSCTDIGDAKAGESCNGDHCAAGLACLGAQGSRACFQLCRTSEPGACSAPQVCQGGMPLFADGYGICVSP